MRHAVATFRRDGMQDAGRRAVLKTARIGRKAIMAATLEAMYDNPGGYDPYKPANFKIPKVRTIGGAVSAGAGYTQEGSFVRFRSTGTDHRYHKDGTYAGKEQGFGMTQQAAAIADPMFEAICRTEMDIELRKHDL